MHYKLGELYVLVMKLQRSDDSWRLLQSTASKVFETDTKQAFFYGDIGDAKINIRAPDWWPEPVSEGLAPLLMKSMYGTKQAARQWHVRISSWMEDHAYMAVNSEKTMFMKRDHGEWIMHGLLVDDMTHASTQGF